MKLSNIKPNPKEPKNNFRHCVIRGLFIVYLQYENMERHKRI
jgi:hypothetical protein